jgi:hypothetical protein
VAPLRGLAYCAGVSSDFPDDMLELQVAEYGPDTRVVTVVGEIDLIWPADVDAIIAKAKRSLKTKGGTVM